MTELTQEQVINMLFNMIHEIRLHTDTNTRINRYRLWQEIKEKNNKENRNIIASRDGYRVYSQNDQDGILQRIFELLGIKTGNFVEFGCDNGIENNTHYLLTRGWHGTWIDTNTDHIEFVKKHFSEYIRMNLLKMENQWIDKDNINEILTDVCTDGVSGEIEDIDLLVIDTDWNDYYLWEALKLNPKVVCIEYNGHIPPPGRLIVPYNKSKEQLWDGSNCFGASLQSIAKLANEKGYNLVACSLAGTDAFFIRKDLYHKKESTNTQIADCFEPARYNLEFNLGHQSSPGVWAI